MATVLVTGFDPFGGETVNPAYEAVKLLPGEIAGARIVKQEIPTAFTRSAVAIEQALDLVGRFGLPKGDVSQEVAGHAGGIRSTRTVGAPRICPHMPPDCNNHRRT